jgi:hypothetical protein
MTQEELIQKKHQLDISIAELLKDFSNETQLSISGIRIDAIEVSNKCDANTIRFIHSVNCQVEL